MKRIILLAVVALAASPPSFAATPAPQAAQEKSASRDAMREKLRGVLDKAAANKDIDTAFRQSEKQPYNFVGVMRTGLANSEKLEIVIGVTATDTIGFRVYPHYKGAYINLDKARNSAGLMRKLLNLSDRSFFYFGADGSGDVFAGYTITLESGFPAESIGVILLSIRNIDKLIGETLPFIDASPAPPK